MLLIRNISYLLPMCCSFWENCINSQNTGLGCSTPLKPYIHVHLLWEMWSWMWSNYIRTVLLLSEINCFVLFFTYLKMFYIPHFFFFYYGEQWLSILQTNAYTYKPVKTEHLVSCAQKYLAKSFFIALSPYSKEKHSLHSNTVHLYFLAFSPFQMIHKVATWKSCAPTNDKYDQLMLTMVLTFI